MTKIVSFIYHFILKFKELYFLFIFSFKKKIYYLGKIDKAYNRSLNEIIINCAAKAAVADLQP